MTYTIGLRKFNFDHIESEEGFHKEVVRLESYKLTFRNLEESVKQYENLIKILKEQFPEWRI